MIVLTNTHDRSILASVNTNTDILTSGGHEALLVSRGVKPGHSLPKLPCPENGQHIQHPAAARC